MIYFLAGASLVSVGVLVGFLINEKMNAELLKLYSDLVNIQEERLGLQDEHIEALEAALLRKTYEELGGNGGFGKSLQND